MNQKIYINKELAKLIDVPEIIDVQEMREQNIYVEIGRKESTDELSYLSLVDASDKDRIVVIPGHMVKAVVSTGGKELIQMLKDSAENVTKQEKKVIVDDTKKVKLA